MMKRMFLAILAAMMLLFPGWLWAQGRIVERTYLSTDRDVYVAGDVLWYSAFCVDASQGTLSPVSGIAYVELHSPDAVVCAGKVALLGGRGAGRLSLPVTVPTGNYRLVAYTAQNKAEEGYDYTGLASKTISVFNVYSNERLTGGVEVVSDGEYESLRSPVRPGMTAGSDRSVMPGSDRASVSLRWDGDSLTVVNAGATPATLSISVFHDDGILSNDNPTIAEFLAACRRQGPVRFDNTVIPEYEGEIIRGHVTGLSPEKLPSLVGRYAFISTPSDKSDVYTSVIDGQGRVEFFTGNIYGNKECICEIEGIDPSLNCFIELESPFVQARVAAVEPLRIAASLKEALSQRSFAMQVERRFTPDTLYELLRVRENGLFGTHEIVYPLDDYTRFPTMGEVFIEFIPEIRARRWPDGRRNIQVRLEDGTETIFSRDTTLMMLDGVPVFDQQKILDYDPLLVESIHIYPRTTFIGPRIYEGVVNFVTYKHNLPAFHFGENARVIDFQGADWPLAATGEALRSEEAYPDYRQTIYWHPQQELPPGATLRIPCKKPDYKGHFRVVVEGLSADGTPLRAETSFELE